MKVAGKIGKMVDEMLDSARSLDGPAVTSIARIAVMLAEAFRAGRRVYVCGNGGSAADAQHIAAELVGRFRRKNRRPLPCVALTTDTSMLTALGNDFGFEHVFSRQVQALGRDGDVLWTLSTSGRSPNVVAAAWAGKKQGMKVVAMTGSDGADLAEIADECFKAPGQWSDQVQQMHQLAYHVICELIDEVFAAGPMTGEDHG